jgi:NADH-quinone oxidoreductase subunit L
MEEPGLLCGRGVYGAADGFLYVPVVCDDVYGEFSRDGHEQEHHLHESPAAMTIPLMVLAILAVVRVFWGYRM